MCDGNGATKFVNSFQQQRDEYASQEPGPQDGAFAAELGPAGPQFNAADLEAAEADFMEGWAGSHMANMEALERSMGLVGGLGATGMEATGGMGQSSGLEHAADFEQAFAEQMKASPSPHSATTSPPVTAPVSFCELNLCPCSS